MGSRFVFIGAGMILASAVLSGCSSCKDCSLCSSKSDAQPNYTQSASSQGKAPSSAAYAAQNMTTAGGQPTSAGAPASWNNQQRYSAAQTPQNSGAPAGPTGTQPAAWTQPAQRPAAAGATTPVSSNPTAGGAQNWNTASPTSSASPIPTSSTYDRVSPPISPAPTTSTSMRTTTPAAQPVVVDEPARPAATSPVYTVPTTTNSNSSPVVPQVQSAAPLRIDTAPMTDVGSSGVPVRAGASSASDVSFGDPAGTEMVITGSSSPAPAVEAPTVESGPAIPPR
ncbi:MAG: hypothetical protein K2R98_09810 [Gemmataceae bacterium]|nr:hypothetical protein [Gemmataceae bacterium]